MCGMCNGQSIDDYVDSVETLIGRYGWALQYVSSSAAAALDGELGNSGHTDDDYAGDGMVDPAFCYTVGLAGMGHPEIVMTGRSPGESAAVLNVLARRIQFGGQHFEAGQYCTAGGFEVSFVDVAYPEEWLLMCRRLYPDGALRAVQAVWRDHYGNLPWEGEYPSTIVQPILGPPPGW